MQDLLIHCSNSEDFGTASQANIKAALPLHWQKPDSHQGLTENQHMRRKLGFQVTLLPKNKVKRNKAIFAS